MATTIAAINGNGRVFAVNAQGVQRPVKAGDTLQKGEILRTPAGTTVELMMEDGQLMQVAANQTVRIDDTVAKTESTPSAVEAGVATTATSDTIIQALERGTDLNETLDATAAGLGGGGEGGGSSFVQLGRIAEGVNGNAYAFGFNGLGNLPITEGVGPTPVVAPTNNPPVATNDNTIGSENDFLRTEEDKPLVIDTKALLSNDTDPDGDLLTLISVQGAKNGTVVLNSDGTVTFTPAANYSGDQASFTYTVSDGKGGVSTATVSVNVTPVDDLFTDGNEVRTVDFNSGITEGSLLANTTVSADGPVRVVSFSIAGQTGTFALGTPFTVAGKGDITVNSDGAYSFTPSATYSGDFPVVSYVLSDGYGATVTSTLSINVGKPTPLDDANESIKVTEDRLFIGNVIDTGIDDATVKVQSFSVAGDGTVYLPGDTATISGKGSLLIREDGTYVFTPALNYSGTVPTVSYTLVNKDNVTNSSELSITVAPVADAPLITMALAASGSPVLGDPVNYLDSARGQDFVAKGLSMLAYSSLSKVVSSDVKSLDLSKLSAEVGTKVNFNQGNGYGVSGPGDLNNGGNPSPSEGSDVIDANEALVVKLPSGTQGDKLTVTLKHVDNEATNVRVLAYDAAGNLVGQSGAILAKNNATVDVSFATTGDPAYIVFTTGETDPNGGKYGFFVQDIFIQEYVYNYTLTTTTGLSDTDGSESLSAINWATLPTGVTYNPDTKVFTSDHPLTNEDLRAITGTVTATDGTGTATDSEATTASLKMVFAGADASAQTIDVQVNGTSGADSLQGGSGNDAMYGGAGSDTVRGNAGDDLIIGGAWNDTLYGGTGVDTFRWNLADVSNNGVAAADVVKDFQVGKGGDVLDLRDLLTSADQGNLQNYLDISKVTDGTTVNTVIAVHATGVDGPVTQTITLAGVDLVGGLTGDYDMAILKQLIDDGNLRTQN